MHWLRRLAWFFFPARINDWQYWQDWRLGLVMRIRGPDGTWIYRRPTEEEAEEWQRSEAW